MLFTICLRFQLEEFLFSLDMINHWTFLKLYFPLKRFFRGLQGWNSIPWNEFNEVGIALKRTYPDRSPRSHTFKRESSRHRCLRPRLADNSAGSEQSMHNTRSCSSLAASRWPGKALIQKETMPLCRAAENRSLPGDDCHRPFVRLSKLRSAPFRETDCIWRNAAPRWRSFVLKLLLRTLLSFF